MRAIINIDVPDLKSAVEFYSKVLDLKLKRIIDDDVAELIGASSVICLLEKAADAASFGVTGDPRNYNRHWTPVHIDFVVDDVEKAASKAIAAGAIRESECIEWRGSKCITLSDPFGHGFCLIQFDGGDYSDE